VSQLDLLVVDEPMRGPVPEAPASVPRVTAWTPVVCAVPGCGGQAMVWSGLHRRSLCQAHGELPHHELVAVLPPPPLDTLV
jgi:hypothetical protein